MFLSMVDSCDEPPLKIQQTEEYKRSFNVAVSRARDQVWLVHSLNPTTDLKPNDIRLRLIQHFEDPSALTNQLLAGESKVDSEFERLVLRDLTNEGFRIVCQWPVGAYRIDLVVIGRAKKIAIECDGDRYHPPEKLADDLARQMVLERLGWTFIRIRGGDYFRKKAQTIAKVVKRLEELGIELLGALSEKKEDDSAASQLRKDLILRAAEIRRQWEETPVTDSQETTKKKPFVRWGRQKTATQQSPSDGPYQTDGNAAIRTQPATPAPEVEFRPAPSSLAALKTENDALPQIELTLSTASDILKWNEVAKKLVSTPDYILKGALGTYVYFTSKGRKPDEGTMEKARRALDRAYALGWRPKK